MGKELEMLISLKDRNGTINNSVKGQNTPMVVNQNATSIDVKSPENLQRQPQEDNFNGKGLDKKKIVTFTSVGTVLATLLGIAIDFKFAEGKHVKKLWRKLTGNAHDIKPKSNETPNISSKADVSTPNIPDTPDVVQPKPNVDIEPPKTTDLANDNQAEIDKQVQEFFEQEEKELAKIKQAKEWSDLQNKLWLNEQHHIKEKEYSDFWNSELEKIEQPLYEQRLKEVEQLKEVIKQERTKFFEAHKNKIPSEEERYQAFLPYMRTEYGSNFLENSRSAKQLAKDPEQWLWYLWYKDPKARAMELDLALKEMKPQDLELYNSAKWVFDNQKLKYSDLDLAYSIYSSELREIIEEVALRGKFSGSMVSGHSLAYQINSPLRLGFEVEDTLRVILDEGFRTVKPLEQGTTVYRTVCGGKADGSIDFINKLINAKKGDTFVDKGYSYTSFSEKGTSPCNGIRDAGTEDVSLTILVPKGARVSDGSGYTKQNELLFPRNAEFRVVEEAKRPEPFVFTSYDGKEVKMPRALEIVLEYVLPKS